MFLCVTTVVRQPAWKNYVVAPEEKACRRVVLRMLSSRWALYEQEMLPLLTARQQRTRGMLSLQHNMRQKRS